MLWLCVVQAGDDDSDDDGTRSRKSDGHRSTKSKDAKTARASEWAHTEIFSDDDDDAGGDGDK